MADKLPESYDVQDGCHNCGACYVLADVESPKEFFCTYGAPKRPKSNAWFDEAEQWDDGGDAFVVDMRAWDNWKNPRRVAAYGVCEHWSTSNG